MSERVRLPNRRVSELVDFEHGGRRWTLTVGHFADGRVGEVFLDTPKASAIGEIAANAAIAASVAFQHGALLETVRHALADRRAGPLGAALTLIDAYQAQHKFTADRSGLLMTSQNNKGRRSDEHLHSARIERASHTGA